MYKRQGLPLLHPFLRLLPGFETLRVANRFIVPAMLALSVIAAIGATRLLCVPRCSRRPRLAVCVVSLICLLDLAWLPYPTREIPSPEWPAVVAARYPGLLLNVPGGYRARGADDMFLQTLHGQPIVGGYTSCVLPQVKERIEDLPFLQLIFEGRPKVRVDDVRSGLERVLRKIDVDTIVLHSTRQREVLQQERAAEDGRLMARVYNPEKGIPAALFVKIRAALNDLWGAAVYTDGDVEIYRRPGR